MLKAQRLRQNHFHTQHMCMRVFCFLGLPCFELRYNDVAARHMLTGGKDCELVCLLLHHVMF